MADEQRPPVIPLPKIKKSRPKTFIPPEKWLEVEQAWALGKFGTLDEMSKHYGIPADKVRERLRRSGVRRGQALEEYNRKLQKELEEKAKQDAKLLADRIAETREDHYKMASGLAKLTWAEILTAKQNSSPFSTVRVNLQSLETAMRVLKMAREERFAVLGVEDENKKNDEQDELPQLIVNELTPEQIEEMRSRDVKPDEDDDEVFVVDTEQDELTIGDEGPEDLMDEVEDST